jgi:hypothetical protein
MFELLCKPSPEDKLIPRNQEMVLNVVLSDRLLNLANCIEGVFGLSDQVNDVQPWKTHPHMVGTK